MNDSFRFVSFADARFADAIVGPRAAPRSVLDHRHRRFAVRARVGASACRARARSTLRDARKTEKPKNRKNETSTAPISRASGGRQNPTDCFPTRHKNRSVGHPRLMSPGVVARPANPHARAMSSDEEEAPAPAMERDEEARRRRRARAIDGSAEAREPRARANDGRGTRAKRAIGGEADDARRRRERDGTEAGDRTTTTTRTMGSR